MTQKRVSWFDGMPAYGWVVLAASALSFVVQKVLISRYQTQASAIYHASWAFGLGAALLLLSAGLAIWFAVICVKVTEKRRRVIDDMIADQQRKKYYN